MRSPAHCRGSHRGSFFANQPLVRRESVASKNVAAFSRRIDRQTPSRTLDRANARIQALKGPTNTPEALPTLEMAYRRTAGAVGLRRPHC